MPVKLDGFSLFALQNRLNACWFNGKMNGPQRECLIAFTAIWLVYTRVLGRDVPISWLAYVLATIYHETAHTMQPIAEYGKGAGRPYGEPDPETGQIYYGRSYEQLTWRVNYDRAQRVIVNLETLACDVPLVMQPDLLLKPVNAIQSILNGMINGWYTGKKLADYLNADTTDYVNARRIINGTDKADTIAAYAREAERAIRLALGQGLERSLVMDGRKGDDVRELQLMLGINADGVAGSVTDGAIRAYQTQRGLLIDGKCGNDTWASLDNIVYDLPAAA